MADPLPLADFFAGLRVQSAAFHMPGARKYSRTSGGEVLTSIMGNALWQGDITLTPGYYRSIADVQAQIEDLDRAGDPFLIHPLPIWSPAHDPDGSIIATRNPVIGSLNANNQQMRIDDLPPGYQLRRGEFLSFTYGSNPLRCALHRVQTVLATANAQGRITVQVTPHIRPGAAVGAAVRFYQPVCKVVIVPGSIKWPSSSALITDRISVGFIQTLR